MSEFFDDTMQGLLEAIEIQNGNFPLKEKENMPAPTFIVSDRANEIVDEIISIRKEQKLTQKELATRTGDTQQTISRFEKKENSPSLVSLIKVVHALGYDLQLVPQ